MTARVVGSTRIPGDSELARARIISSNNSSSSIKKECLVCFERKEIVHFPVGFFSCDYDNKSITQAVSTLFTPLEQRHSDKVCIECIQKMLIEANPPQTQPKFSFFKSKVVRCPSCRAGIFATKVIRCFPAQADRLFPGLQRDIAIYTMENKSAHTSALFISIFCTFVVRVAGFSLAEQFTLACAVGFGPLQKNVRNCSEIFGVSRRIHRMIALTPIFTSFMGSCLTISFMKITGLSLNFLRKSF